MQYRRRWTIRRSLAVLALGLGAGVLISWTPSWVYGLTGGQWAFNRAVSWAVPREASLAQLEAVVGPGRPVLTPPWLRQTVLREPSLYPDGWRVGDTSVSYSFPDKSVWYFQIRDGRLVNYDPSVMAGQPQEHFTILR